jgi:hypothetical protein
MGLGTTWYSVYIPVIAAIPFYITTWEEYYSGVLTLGVINGPTEGILIAALLMLASGFLGKSAGHNVLRSH